MSATAPNGISHPAFARVLKYVPALLFILGLIYFKIDFWWVALSVFAVAPRLGLPAHSATEPMHPQIPLPLARQLSPRETTVLELTLQGCSSNEVADLLHIAPSSARVYLSRIYEKAQVSNLAELRTSLAASLPSCREIPASNNSARLVLGTLTLLGLCLVIPAYSKEASLLSLAAGALAFWVYGSLNSTKRSLRVTAWSLFALCTLSQLDILSFIRPIAPLTFVLLAALLTWGSISCLATSSPSASTKGNTQQVPIFFNRHTLWLGVVLGAALVASCDTGQSLSFARAIAPLAIGLLATQLIMDNMIINRTWLQIAFVSASGLLLLFYLSPRATGLISLVALLNLAVWWIGSDCQSWRCVAGSTGIAASLLVLLEIWCGRPYNYNWTLYGSQIAPEATLPILAVLICGSLALVAVIVRETVIQKSCQAIPQDKKGSQTRLQSYLQCRGLTDTQAEILSLLLAGLTGPQTANKLSYSLGTVNTARMRGFAQLNVHSIDELRLLVYSAIEGKDFQAAP